MKLRNEMLGKDLETLWKRTSDIVEEAVKKNPTAGIQYLLDKLVAAAADKEEVAEMVQMLGEMVNMEIANRKQRRADAATLKKVIKNDAEIH